MLLFAAHLLFRIADGGFFLSFHRETATGNAYYLLKDTTYQTNLLLNDRFSTMFEQLYNTENHLAVQHMVLNVYSSEPDCKYADLIQLNERLNEIYRNYPKMIDSIYICFNNGHQFQLLNDAIPTKVGIRLDDWLRKYRGSDKGYYWINDHQDPIFRRYEKRRVISCLKVIGTPVS